MENLEWNVKEYKDNGLYFKSIINSLKPRTNINTIAQAGGSQLLFRLWASCIPEMDKKYTVD